MIKINRGNTKMKGTMMDLMSDYSGITRNMVKMLMENGLDREKALEMVTEAHNIGKLTEEELKKEAQKAIRDTMSMIIDVLGGEEKEEKADEEGA